MTTARIIESWDMPLPEPNVLGEPWFLDWVLRSPRQAGTHLTAGWLAMSALADDGIASVREYFGGIGAQAMMARYLFDPTSHVVQDYSHEAVDHIRSLGFDGHVADAYDPANTSPADLAILDFGDLTAWRAFRPDPRAALLERVFMLEPKAVMVTDIASRYLHLHRSRYETLLGEGTCGSYPDYLAAFAERMQETHGYSLLRGFHHGWSTVMVYVPYAVHGPVSERLAPTPDTPVGLVLS